MASVTAEGDAPDALEASRALSAAVEVHVKAAEAAAAAADVESSGAASEDTQRERKVSDAVSATSGTFSMVEVESGTTDSPSSSAASPADKANANPLLSRVMNGFGGEASSAPETLTPIEDALHASPNNSASSTTSYDSAPSITAIERTVSAMPGVTTRRGDFAAETESETSTPRDDKRTQVGELPKPKTAPTLERAHTSSELIGLRNREARGTDKSAYSSPSNSTPSFEIESVLLPPDGIKEIEIDKAMHTVFAVEVRLQGGLQWIIRKRYSDFRDLHDRLKRTNIPVKQLYFPKRHVFRNRHQSVIEQRRSELEKYINEVLEIRPMIRVPLFNFLEVYAHLESYERKLQRHKKELESERMKNLLEPGQLEDFTAAFKRLSTSKYLYHGNSKADPAEGTHSNSTTSHSATPAKQPGSQPTSPVKNGNGVSSGSTINSSAATEDSSRNSIAHTEGSQICISRASFRRDILGVFPDMPSSFAMRFMKAVSDRQGSDINMDEFLRAVAILRRGTMEDKLQFVYNMCDLDHAGKVQSTGLSNFLVSLHGRHVLDRSEYRRLLNDGFEQGRRRMTTDEFVNTVSDLNAYDMLVDWMDPFVDILCETADPELLESQEEFNPAVQQKILATETQFNGKEVSILQLPCVWRRRLGRHGRTLERLSTRDVRRALLSSVFKLWSARKRNRH
jgi:Ca2+-binding EF-hand superfamily protein